MWDTQKIGVEAFDFHLNNLPPHFPLQGTAKSGCLPVRVGKTWVPPTPYIIILKPFSMCSMPLFKLFYFVWIISSFFNLGDPLTCLAIYGHPPWWIAIIGTPQKKSHCTNNIFWAVHYMLLKDITSHHWPTLLCTSLNQNRPVPR